MISEERIKELWAENRYDPQDFARAIEAEAQRVPDGWKLVPVEPTAEMLHRVDGASIINFEEAAEACALSFEEIQAIYRAMLSAAPEPVQQEAKPEKAQEPTAYLVEGFDDRAMKEE